VLTHELKGAFARYEQAVDANSAFFTGIEVLNAWFDVIQAEMPKVPLGGDAAAHVLATMQSHLHNVNFAAPIRATGFVKSALSMEAALRRFISYSTKELDHTQILAGEIADLLELYDTYMSQKSGVNALPLVTSAHELRLKLTEFKQTVKLVIDAMSTQYQTRVASEAEVSVQFSSEQSVQSFWMKLRAIEQIYSELCQLLNVSQASHPLRILKIESGSMFLSLGGDVVVVGALVAFLKAAIQYIHRNHTNEGRLDQIPRKLEKINEALKFTKLLEKAGLNVDEPKANLEKGALKITDDLNVLFSDEAEVTVNDEIFSAGDERRTALLANRAPPLLRNSAELQARKDPGKNIDP
jgi:hypothetical protein